MNLSQQVLSEITIFSKYARYLDEENRRESWEEIVERNITMHAKKYPLLEGVIREAFQYVKDKKVLPSMRTAQFAGKPIELNNSRGYNCSFLAINDYRAFSEVMFLLLGGVGVGFSVQRHHVEELPEIRKPVKTRRYLIGDSIEGWADAVKVLIKAYLCGKSKPLFVFDQIRAKGSRIVTAGGKAPGPEPLKKCLFLIEEVLGKKENGEKLTSLECHDILCLIADAVLAGGIRRAAMISLFSIDDMEMLRSKSYYKVDNLEYLSPANGAHEVFVFLNGTRYDLYLSEKDFQRYGDTGEIPWYYFFPWRQRANNSVVLLRAITKKTKFFEIWDEVRKSGAGEPGIFFTNDPEIGTNPCAEISLRNRGFCNLTTLNLADVDTQEELERRVWAAAVIGTLQASFTDFHYLREEWKTNAEKEALLGISMTGIAMHPNYALLDFEKAVGVGKDTNVQIAKEIGIRPAARLTTIKPEGTSSCVLGTSSGIHASHAYHYIRRMRVNRDEDLYLYLKSKLPQLVADELLGSGAIIELPQKSPEGAILRYESPIDLLERVKFFHNHWILPGHRDGANTHNVSATISVKEEEWGVVGEWMWENRSSFNGLSVLPYDGGHYVQAPFEECEESTYNKMFSYLKEINLREVREEIDKTNLKGELACAGGACDVKFL